MVTKRREDIFVSVCFADYAPTSVLRRLSAELSARYRYWEILVAAHADKAAEIEPLLSNVPNLRLLKIRNGTPFYRRRAAVASEAIGDVVLLTSADELSGFDPVELIEAAHARGTLVVGRRQRRGFMNPVLVALGRSAGFRVDGRDMLTAAFPRTLLNQILAHPERQLALRFPPMDNGIPVLWCSSGESGKGGERSFHELGRRLGLIQKLIISSAPRVLTLVALGSLVVALCAVAFAIYASIVWLMLENVQPGWFTTSIVLSLTAAFLGSAVFGMSIGLQKVIEALADDVTDDIIGEQSAVDMFEHVFHELNVDAENREVLETSVPSPTVGGIAGAGQAG